MPAFCRRMAAGGKQGRQDGGLLALDPLAVAFVDFSTLRRHVLGALLSALRSQSFCSRVLAVALNVAGPLAGGNAHDLHGIAYHVGGALLSFGSGRH